MIDTTDLKEEIVEELTVELENEGGFNDDILAIKVKNAIRDVVMRRNYNATKMTDAEILDDLYNYYSSILNLARYDYNMLGAEGESKHSENGIVRDFNSRDSILSGVHAFVKVL